MTIEIIKAAIEAKKLEIKEKQAEIDSFEIEVTDSQYDEVLDDCYPDVSIGDLTFSPSFVIKNCDPTAYRCGKSDYADSFDHTATIEYQDLEEERENLESELEDLELELEEAELEENE